MTGEFSEVAQLTRIAVAVEKLVELHENPIQSVTVGPPASDETDDWDPTFAALAGACFSMADQLEEVLNLPDQFKKAQELRNLVTRMRSLAEKYAENAKAEDYRHQMQTRIRRVESEDGPTEEQTEPDPEPDPRYAPKGQWKGPVGGDNDARHDK